MEDTSVEHGRPWWLDHLPLLLTLMAGVFVTIRILSAASFNLTTAYGILQSSGTVAVLLGALLSSIGLLSLAIVAFCVISLDSSSYLRHPDHRLERQTVTAAAIVFGIVALLTLEIRFYVLLLTLLVLLVVVYLVLAYILAPLWNWA